MTEKKTDWDKQIEDFKKNDIWPTEELAGTYLGWMTCQMCHKRIPNRGNICKICGNPDMKLMMEYYKDDPKQMELFYRMMSFFEDKGWIVYTKVPLLKAGAYPNTFNVGAQVFSFMFNDPLGIDVYLIWSIKDAYNIMLREVVTSPHIAEKVCERLREENKLEGIEAQVVWERAPLNHP